MSFRLRSLALWTGLLLFVLGSILLVEPRLPVSAAGGAPLQHVPHPPLWLPLLVIAAGIVLMRRAR